MNPNAAPIPASQIAVQLIGPNELILNPAKPVDRPGPRQVLVQLEAVGLCFSDLKLLKQFSYHARKGEVVEGLSEEVLRQIPSYVPGDAPTVPGHEVVGRIVAVGPDVSRHAVGERVLIETDYRTLKTDGSNAAFGYNFEGGLQQYVLMDERVIVDPESGERYLIPVSDRLSASAICLVEPWACVEHAYQHADRRAIKPGGNLLVAADAERRIEGMNESFDPAGLPVAIGALCADEAQFVALEGFGVPATEFQHVDDLPAGEFDDIVYYGSNPRMIEALDAKLAAGGIINVVTGGRSLGVTVSVGVGRVHYGMTRWIGTGGTSAAESYQVIPSNGEIRDGDKVLIVGAGGPMGQMHVIRNICSGRRDVSIVATDFDDARLAALEKKVRPLADARGVNLRMVNPRKEAFDERFTYIALMAPVGALVADAIQNSAPGCLIDIFAGIPAAVRHELDLDAYIAHRCYMFGTSGSEIHDMKIVLEKVESGALDTNASVDAIGGLDGAIDGIAAVENRTLAGKIIIFPALRGLGLIPLAELAQHFPSVAARLDDGRWCKQAETALLDAARGDNQ